MTERTINANGIDIWTESFGNPRDIPLLLVMGATAQGIYWEGDFCRQLVEGGRYVIRYDNRDTGQSSCIDFASQPYTLNDMAEDAVGVLDAYGIGSAHAVGASMGGMICQILAIQHRERVKTITSIMSTPICGTGAPELGGGAGTGLPPPSAAFIATMKAFGVTPTNRAERIDWSINKFAAMAGTLVPFDRDAQRRVATLEVDRARNFQAMHNHALAISASRPVDRRPLLRKLDIRALVIHGSEDPILRYEHGVATAEAIPGARLLTLERVGHEMPRAVWPEIVGAILEHTA